MRRGRAVLRLDGSRREGGMVAFRDIEGSLWATKKERKLF